MPREAVYYGIAALVALLMQQYACSSASEAASDLWSLLVWFAIIGGGILVASRERGTFRASLLLFIAVAAVIGAFFTASQMATINRADEIARAESARRQLLDQNSSMPAGADAILTEALTGDAPGTRLRVAFEGIRFDLGPLPTKEVMSLKEWRRFQDQLWQGADEDSIVEQPDLYRIGGGYEGRNRYRVWFGPRWGDEMLLGARLTIRNESERTVHFLLSNLRLDISDDIYAEPRCKGWLTTKSRFIATERLTVPPSRSIKGLAVFAVEREIAGRPGTLTVEAPELVATWSDGVLRWRPADEGGVVDDWGQPVTPIAASWVIEGSSPRWVKVVEVSGIGSSGNYDSDFATESSAPFALTGGPIRLRWTLTRGAGSYGSGPYFFGSIEPERTLSYEYTFRNPVLETDFYHSSHKDLDGVQAGKYTLEGAALNCDWHLELTQQRWD